MKLFSTLDRKVVDIVTNDDGIFRIYSCGPTVYNQMHLGNVRAYVNWDILHRALLYLGYDVKRIMNVTDVGHMTSSDDFGDDFGEEKMDRQAKKEGLEPIDIANKYIGYVLNDFRRLNILSPCGKEIPKELTYSDIGKYGWTRATEYIDEMIELIKKIEANGYTYETDQALYFDVSKFPEYAIFTGQELAEKEEGARGDVNVDPQKKNPADFVLWMKRVGRYKDHIMNWDSPWGNGFPGWHIECSAMGVSNLGEYIDIHTGGIDHIPVHHTNERAQNIGALGHAVVKYWVHNEWLVNKNDEKLSKSKGADTLDAVLDLGYDPMDVRFFFLSVNYHSKINFSFTALDGARNSRVSLMKKVAEISKAGSGGELIKEYVDLFKKELENNLNMSGVLALINDMIRSSKYSNADKFRTVLDFDRVLALNLKDVESNDSDIECSDEVKELLEKRMSAKLEKNYVLADEIRDRIEKLGFRVMDTGDGQKVIKIR